MLILVTPIRLGKNSYDRLVGGIKGEWDLRTRKIDVQIAPGRSQDGRVVIGTKEMDGDKGRLLAPPILSTLTIQDTFPPKPELADLFAKLQTFIEALEAVMATSAEFQAQIYQAGEDEVKLTSTFVAYPTDAFQFEVTSKP